MTFEQLVGGLLLAVLLVLFACMPRMNRELKRGTEETLLKECDRD